MKFGMKKNEEAVSPVIGVILMVVITVIIAAILAVFAFGIGGPQKAPETQLRFVADGTANTLTVSNTGGDTLILANERISISDAANSTTYYLGTASGGVPLGAAGATLAPGGVITAPAYSSNPQIGKLLRVVVADVPTGQIIADAKVTVQ